ncbi:hypothetical protein BH11ACT7_BH11ACT7_35540 [soil metagenome]
MTRNAVTVDLDRLRAAANRVQRSAQTLSRFELPGLDGDAMAGSLVGRVAGPVSVASRLADLSASIRGWADAARSAASAFDDVDRDNATRI